MHQVLIITHRFLDLYGLHACMNFADVSLQVSSLAKHHVAELTHVGLASSMPLEVVDKDAASFEYLVAVVEQALVVGVVAPCCFIIYSDALVHVVWDPFKVFFIFVSRS